MRFGLQLFAAVSLAHFGVALVQADALTNAAALWKFDGASSGFVTSAAQIVDSSGNGHNATAMTNPGNTNIAWASVPLTGPGGASTVNPFGSEGRGVSLQPYVVTPGLTDTVQTVGFTVNNFSVTGSATIATRFLWDGYISDDPDARNAWMYNNGYGASSGWLFGMVSDQLRLFQFGGGLSTFAATLTIQTGIWYDAVAVLTENGESGGPTDSVSFYIFPDGGSLYTTNITGTITNRSGTISNIGGETLGQGSSNQRKAFDGTIDYLAVWDRALSQEEVLGLIIPEPSAVALLGAGGVVLGLLARRRRR